MRIRVRTLVTAMLVVTTASTGWAQVSVDEFVVAEGKARFDETLLIRGTDVIWQRCWGDDLRLKDTIQYKSLSRLDVPEVDLADYPCKYGSIVLGPTHLFWKEDFQVLARPLEALADGRKGANIPVAIVDPTVPANKMRIDAANADYLFLRTGDEQDASGRYRGRLLAKTIGRLTDPSFETLREIARYKRIPSALPVVAVSDEYYVWADMDPDVGEKTWTLYAKRVDELFVPGAERRLLDTRSTYLNVDMHLHGSRLVFVGSMDPDANEYAQIYLLDLDGPAEPVAVAKSYDPDVLGLEAPGVSPYYVVWDEIRDSGPLILSDRVFCRRLEDGVPVGEPFPLTGEGGGSWLAFDENIAVWTGRQIYTGGGFEYGSVVAAELPLPGATDLGDVDASGAVDITDAIVILSHLFAGGWRPRLRLADVDASGNLEISDAIRILQHLFLGVPLSP